MQKVFFPLNRLEKNNKAIADFNESMKNALKLAILSLRKDKRANDHKFGGLPTKYLWISDIGGRKGGRILYLKNDNKLIIWGLGPNHKIEEEAERFFNNKLREIEVLESELFDVTHNFLSEKEEKEIADKTKIFAGNISDEFLRTSLFLNDYQIGEIRKSNELSLWNLQISDVVKFKLMQYLKLPKGVLLQAKDESHLDSFIKGSTEKLMIHLDDYQEKIIDLPLRKPLLLRGETGSGKTTILIYKAIYYAEAHPNEECILFTYNISLANLIKDAKEELIGKSLNNLEIYPIFQWIEELFPIIKSEPIFLENKKEFYIYDILQNFYNESNLRKFNLSNKEFNLFLKKEIEEIILSYGIDNLEKYILFKRKGTDRKLGKIQRSIVWNVYQKFLTFLIEHKITTYQKMIFDFYKLIDKKDFEFKKDAIFVDEVQDLSSIAIKIISKIRKDDKSIVMIAGDYKQTIYRKSFSWNDVKLPFYGSNVIILKKNYRNTKEILFAAHNMLKKFMPKIEEPLHSGRSGHPVEIIKYENKEMFAKLKGIIAYLQQNEGIELSDIAIFGKSKDVNLLISKLSDNNIPAISINNKRFTQAGDAVRVSTLHSAKGLEFRAVIIINAEKNLMDFKCNDLNLKKKIAAKLLYVGMTRAYDALFFLVQKGFKGNEVMEYVLNN
jgi:hypothetical protein